MDWKKVWEEVKAWFISEGKEIEEELAPFGKQFASSIGSAVLTAAESAVAQFATQSITGSAKKDLCFTAIVDNLKTQGLTAATSLVNSAIEICVAKLKSVAPPSA